jgi:hypothetical protein
LNVQQLKLVEFTSEYLNKNTLECLIGQDRITHASFRYYYDSSKANLSELKSLEVLNIVESRSESAIDLSSNKNLVRVVIDKGFAVIKSGNLKDLILPNYDPSKETLEEIATNCPNLRYLQVNKARIDSIFQPLSET